MRIALVSPYSYTYPGGVLRHMEALADQYLAAGHHVRLLAPYDPPDALSARLHRGAHPQERPLPEHVIPLGRTLGFPANGAVSNLSVSPSSILAMRRELRAGDFDVVHLHEPVAFMLGWDAMCSSPVPTVGTFHAYSTNPVTNNLGNLAGARRRMNHLKLRVAVSEAAAWTARRYFGGHYRVIPSCGLEQPRVERPAAQLPLEERPMRIAFVGQAVERKGLPVLLRAFEALREHIPCELTIVGAQMEEVAPLLLDQAAARDVHALGKVDDDRKHEVLQSADVFCAPSLGGESFGLVLIEALAAGTPVVCSDLPGYADVVRDGVDSALFPRGDAKALGETLRDLALDPARRARMAVEASRRAERFTSARIASELLAAYEDAIAVPEPATRLRRAAVRVGALPADGLPREPARRIPSLEPAVQRKPAVAFARRVGIALAGLAGVALAYYALRRIGVDQIIASLVRSSPALVVGGLALMCASMVTRAISWRAILRAAVPGARLRFVELLRATTIGVLMSTTLPARLGEPSRALIMARRIGRARESLPTVLGTIMSQTLINILALVGLGVAMFSTANVFAGHHGALVVFSVAPAAILVSLLVAPTLLGGRATTRLGRLGQVVAQVRSALARVRDGLRVFRSPRLAFEATAAQFVAWALQWLSCFVLLSALGLGHHGGLGAAAAVLFAVNVTAAVPVTPSNVGVFQATCVAVLTAGYGISSADALGFGIILQAVEVAAAVVMGAPSLVKEGLSWREVRLRALHHAPVELRPLRNSGHGASRVQA